MRLPGRIWTDGKHWLVDVPTLDATTQGRTRAEAIRMVGDLIATMAGK
jgi:predicted RNase H-like HicB family nuclease